MSVKNIAVIKGGRADEICKIFEGILKRSGFDKELEVTTQELPLERYGKKILAITEKTAKIEWDMSFNTVIYPYGVEKTQFKSDLLISYDTENDKADITARNIRKVDDKMIFELLGTGIIARLKIKDYGDSTVNTALLAASIMLCSGIPLKDVVTAVSC